jgi:hypothetical protein
MGLSKKQLSDTKMCGICSLTMIFRSQWAKLGVLSLIVLDQNFVSVVTLQSKLFINDNQMTTGLKNPCDIFNHNMKITNYTQIHSSFG